MNLTVDDGLKLQNGRWRTANKLKVWDKNASPKKQAVMYSILFNLFFFSYLLATLNVKGLAKDEESARDF